MSSEPLGIVGRERELRGIVAFLEAIEAGPTALVLDGEVGIGKTSLWRRGVAEAAARDHRVLASRPIGAEAKLAYAALGDLLADVPEWALADLPAPQRRAIEVALFRAEPDEPRLAPQAVALGLLGVLRALGREGPTLVAVDDVHCLDEPTRSALAFVARRLTDEPIGLLVAQRVDGAAEVPLDLERALPQGRLRSLPLASLPVADLDVLLRARLRDSLPRRTLERLHRVAGGNPFFALEIGNAILRSRDPLALDGIEAELPIPPSLQQLVGERLGLLSASARHAAQVAAALSRPTSALVESVTGERQGIVEAAAAGIVEVDGERVRFAHPLLASVAYAQLPVERRRELHARLAELLEDPEERGRHLALAAQHPSAEVASALDDAAGRARARGAPGAAAELLEQARRLTPAAARDTARRRGVQAAERHFETGDTRRARDLLQEVAAESPPGRDRAHALARLGWVRAHTEGFRAGAEVFAAALAALDEREDDVAVRIQIEEGLAWCLHSTVGVPDAESHARTALRLAEALAEPTLLAGALSMAAFLESLWGRGVAMEMIERAVELGPAPEWSQILGRPDWVHGLLLEWSGELAASYVRFQALHKDAVDRGDEHSLPFILFHLARIELLRGYWREAGRHAAECHQTTLQSGQVTESPYSLTIQVLVEAHRGAVEPAMAKIDEGLRLADEAGVRPAGFELLAARGFLELSLGDVRAADRSLDQLAAMVGTAGLREPALFRFHGDAIEAKVVLGLREEAGRLLAELDELGAVLGRPWVLAIASRCRGLLSAANGDLGGAYLALERSLELHDRLDEPFERARTQLALGSVQRRDRKKRAARESLGRALATFDQLGATLWARRARAELARVGGRAPSAGLTPTEARIAELIASGRTYQQAADALFISPKTVQWNLSKIYRKLGIRSRAELAGRLSAEASAPEPPVRR
jgi:DNA-binding CsgD family transcriptional regulator